MDKGIPHLDNKDLKILFELDKNSRIPISRLSKKLRISREITKYRIKKLTQTGIIKSFITIINPSKLDYTIYKVYLKLQNLSKTKEELLTNFLSKHEDVFWVANCNGNFDLIIGVYAKEVIDFNDFLFKFIEMFGQNIVIKRISNSVWVEVYRKDYLSDERSEPVFWGGKSSEVEIDNDMKKILKMLAEESRTPIAEICEKLKISPKTAISKIKKLEKEKVILGYRTILDLNKLNEENFKAIIYFNEINKEKEKTFLDYCRANKNIIYCIKTIADWDFELDIEVEDFKKFSELIKEIKNNFKEIIKQIDFVHIANEPKGELNIAQRLS